MRSTIESALGSHSIYHARRKEFDTGQKIPFRVSPRPLELSLKESSELNELGVDMAHYFTTVDALYNNDDTVRKLLDRGKPEIFLGERPQQYLFIRPDIIITPRGFSVCEVETSPFGLALAEVLNRAYRDAGHETLITNGTLPAHIQAHTPSEGTLIFSNKTQQYSGQMTFLADQVFSNDGNRWQAKHVDDVSSEEPRAIYRGFYLAEHVTDPAIKALLTVAISGNTDILPSPTPHLEEKAILSFIWDKRFENHLRQQLGDAAFKHLRKVIPPTWIVGEEAYFAPGLPDNVSSAVDLANLSRSKRTFVLKNSGFQSNSSWSEGVHLLHEKSADKASSILDAAVHDSSSLHIIQDFTKLKIYHSNTKKRKDNLFQCKGEYALLPTLLRKMES